MVTAATMNAEEAVPYIWEERPPPPEQVLKLWYEVGNKLDKESKGERIKEPWSSGAETI